VTKQAFGRLDILVNNAGIYNLFPLEEVTEENFRRHINTNVLGLLLATPKATKLFGDQGGSVITPHGRTGQPDDIAPVAVFLASDESRWITGDTLVVSGDVR
jgi:NAD(P)-dependent dehydrogenase (short-subunit alcohol dehydrogenase family)